MDNFDLVNFNEQGDGSKPHSKEDEPLKIDLGGSEERNGVSRQPLNLGGGAAPQPVTPNPIPSAKPAPAKLSYTGPPPESKADAGSAFQSQGERISGVKTFFTKLHHGSVVFMDEQIANWLKSNPGVQIKETNVCTGDVVAKKTEPNLIVMIWY